eukprot:gene4179-biopygen7163
MEPGRNMTEPGRNVTEPGRNMTELNSVLQDGGRGSRTEDRTEPDFQIPGRRTEPSSDSVLQDGGRSWWKFRPPLPRKEYFLSFVLQDGGRNFETRSVLQDDARTAPSHPCFNRTLWN